MATSNLWEITLLSQLQAQDCENVFYYRGNALTSPDAGEIGEAFVEQIVPDILATVTNEVYFASVSVRDILAGSTPVITVIDETGTLGSGATLPAHDAMGFTLGVGSTTTRPGHKRFPGVGEDYTNEGVITDAGLISALSDLALTLAFNLFDTTTGLVPWAAAVVVKRILDGESYRLPTSVGEAVTNLVTEVIPSLLVTSQVSRKQKPS